jgi:hypothetical protein
VDLYAGGCSDKLAPIWVVCLLVLNALLCFHPWFVVVVPDADGDPDSMWFFGGCSSLCLTLWNTQTHLRSVSTRLQAARTTSRSPRFLPHFSGSEPPLVWSLALFIPLAASSTSSTVCRHASSRRCSRPLQAYASRGPFAPSAPSVRDTPAADRRRSALQRRLWIWI